MIIIFSIAIGIGIYIANKELTNAGKKQDKEELCRMRQGILDIREKVCEILLV